MKKIYNILGKAKLGVAAAVLAGVSMLWLSGLAGAAELQQPQLALGMMPTMQDVTLAAGESKDYEVTVVNDGTTALNIEMSAVPYTMKEDYSSNIFDAPSTRTQISQWVAFNAGEDKFRLEGSEQKIVHFTIDVPTNAPAGGQYAAITARGQIDGESSGVNATYQIASLFLSEIDGTTVRGGEITNREYGGWYASPDVVTKLTVRNTGNTHFFVTNRLIVENVFGGGEVARVEGPSNIVFGEDERDFEVTWTSEQPIGFYYLIQESDFLGESHVERRLVVILPIWVIILCVLVLIAIIALIIASVKRRKKAKAKTSTKAAAPAEEANHNVDTNKDAKDIKESEVK
jgi:hypothetical protein